MNNRRFLIIITIVSLLLAGAYLISEYIIDKGNPNDIPVYLAEFDTTHIERILITIPEESRKVEFRKNQAGWSLSNDTIKVEVEEENVRVLIREIRNLLPEQVVTDDERLWNNYEVDLSNSVNLQIFDNNQILVAELHLGKSIVDQSGKVTEGEVPGGITYIRITGSNRVYQVRSLLGLSLRRKFNHWRNLRFSSFEPDSIKQITAIYPEDSGFTMVCADKIWYVGNKKADSLKTLEYLNFIKSRNNDLILDACNNCFQEKFRLEILLKSGENLKYSASESEEHLYFFRSSQNPGTTFYHTDIRFFQAYFKPVWYFRKN